MGIADLLWMFFMLSALQPVIRQKMLEASRLRVLHRFERKRKSRVDRARPPPGDDELPRVSRSCATST